jgi:outer membrane cobalamin receptor
LRLFTFLAAAWAAAAAPSLITGTVIDPSGRAVPGAQVACGSATSTTNDQGQFQLNAADCDARITREGFEAMRVRLKAGVNQVRLNIARLNEAVVVSATRVPTALEESNVAANVLTARDLEQRQYPLLADLLRDLPGLTVMQSGRRGGVTSLFTRGAARTGTLVLLDGIPVNDPGGPLDAAHLSTGGLDRVEVVRGPQSAMYGADAAASVIQMFSKRGDVESARPHGEVSYERGSFQTDRWLANLNGGLWGRLDYSLTADQYHSVGQFQNDFYRNTTGTANAGLRLTDQTSLRAVFRTYDTALGTPGQVAYGVFDFDARNLVRDSTFGVKLEDSRSSRFYQRASFGYHRNRLDSQNPRAEGPYRIAALTRRTETPVPRIYLLGLVDPSTPASAVPPGATLAVRSTSTFAGNSRFFSDRMSADYQGTLTDSNGALAFGYRFEDQGGVITRRDVARNNNGLFAHRQQRWGRLYLTGGVRWERSSAFGHRAVGRGGAAYQLLGERGIFSSTVLRVSGGRGITEPELLQNFAQDPFFVGNRALRPERTLTFETALTQELFARRLRLEAAWFRNRFGDLIQFVSRFPNPGTWENLEASWARGAELSASGRVWRYVSVNSSYTRLYTRVVSSTSPASLTTGIGQPLLRRPLNSGSISVSVAPRRFTFVMGGRFVGERNDTGSPFGVTRVAGYEHVFASASWRAHKHVTPFFRLENALNNRYEEVMGFTALGRYAAGGIRVGW